MKPLTKERLLTAASVAVISLASPAISYAQNVSGDAGAVMTSLVSYLLGAFGVGVASIFIMIIALGLGVGRIAFEGLLIIGVTLALYFGGPGIIAKVANAVGGGNAGVGG